MKDGFYKRLIAKGNKPLYSVVIGSRTLAAFSPSLTLTPIADFEFESSRIGTEYNAVIANYGMGYVSRDENATEIVALPGALANADMKGASNWMLGGSTGYAYHGLDRNEMLAEAYPLNATQAGTNGGGGMKGCAVIWVHNGVAWEGYAMPVMKFLKSRTYAKLTKTALNTPMPLNPMDILNAQAITIVIPASSSMQFVVPVVTPTGDSSYLRWSEVTAYYTAMASLLGVVNFFGFSPTGRPLTEKVSTWPAGLSVGWHKDTPTTVYAAVQGLALKAWITSILTRNSRSLTADEITYVAGIRDGGYYCLRRDLANKVNGPANVWQHHSMTSDVYDEDGFDDLTVKGTGSTTKQIRNRIAALSSAVFGGTSAVPPATRIKYLYNAATHTMNYTLNNVVCTFGEAMAAKKTGGYIDSLSTTNGIDADASITGDYRTRTKAQVQQLVGAQQTVVSVNPFIQLFADMGTAVSSDTWVMSHCTDDASKGHRLVTDFLERVMTPFSANDLKNVGRADESSIMVKHIW